MADKTPYQSTHTGAEIDAGIDLLDKNSATNGQVLTANGTGGATWQNASGGTKLYKHVIGLYYDAGTIEFTFCIISSYSTKITLENYQTELNKPNFSVPYLEWHENTNNKYAICFIKDNKFYFTYKYYNTAQTDFSYIEFGDNDLQTLTDTVTEL